MNRAFPAVRLFEAFTKTFESLQPSLKVSLDADELEAKFGERSLEQVRDRILTADRAARRELYRVHDELARRRRADPGDRFVELNC
jgi:hypothetical protein